MKAKVKYIIDEKGDRTAVVIPIGEWNLLKKELIEFQEFQKLKQSLKKGFKEVDNMVSGKVRKKTFDEFFEEIK